MGEIDPNERVQIARESELQIFSVRESRRLADQKALREVLAAWSLSPPTQPSRMMGTSAQCCSWIEPHAWIVTLATSRVDDVRTVAGIYVTDITAGLCAFRLSGSRSLSIMACGCDPAIVPPGASARLRFADLGAVIVQRWTGHEWRLLVNVSVAHTCLRWLEEHR